MKKLIRLYQTFLDYLEQAALIFAMVLTGALLLVSAGGIAVELTTGSSLVWIEEVSNLLFCWAVFVGAGAIARRGGHIGVDIVQDMAGPRLLAALHVLFAILVMIVVWVMVYYGYKMALFVGRSQSSLYLNISLYYYYLSVPVGGVILGLITIGSALPGAPVRFDLDEIEEF